MSVRDGLEFRVIYQTRPGILPVTLFRRSRSVIIRQTAEAAEKLVRWAEDNGCEARVQVRQVGPWVDTDVRRT